VVSGSRPETKYARLGDDRIAYQVSGKGPIDIVYTFGSTSSIDVLWDYPDAAYFLERLAGFSRVIGFDARGTGASDPLPSMDSFGWETWVDDTQAVLDTVGSARAAVFAMGDACPAAMLLAATEPERVAALVLVGAASRYTQSDDYPYGMLPGDVAQWAARVADVWGTEQMSRLIYPSRADDPRFREWMARYLRAGASPRVIEGLYNRMYQLDARPALPLIHAPTLILGSNFSLYADHVGYTAERIEGARVEWFDTKDGSPIFSHTDQMLDLIEEFLTGAKRVAEPDRRLATVLFTDIVGSTDRASALGDSKWRRLLDEHDDIVRERVTRLGGKLIKTTGDGALATFEGPAKCIRSTIALREALTGIDVKIRAGLHAGEVELRGDDVGGIAVHIAARVMGEADPGEILASSTVKDLVVGSGISFLDRGTRALKGIPDEWRLFAVESV
jgi:class 3 adenylate cyclase/pimeloyl-ACP methyl ester carboxylesterase